MVNVTVNRPGGVNVTVDKKDTGEIVPNITEQPTLVNAGVAQRGVTGTVGTFEDITLNELSDHQLLIFNTDTSSFENKTISGDLLAYSNGSLELTPTGVTPGSYGSNSQAITLTVDYQGRLSAISTNTIRGVSDLIYTPSINELSLSTSDSTTSNVVINTFGDEVTFDDNIIVAGQVVANSFSGNGALVTSVNASELDDQVGAFYRIESAAYTVANNTLTFTRGDANTFDLALTGVANTSATVNTSTSSASFAAPNNTITFVRADSSTFDVTVSGGVTSGALVGNTIILTKSDSTTVDVDISNLVDKLILSGSFEASNNTLTLLSDNGDTVKVDLNAGVSSGVLVGNTVVFTRTDSSTFDIDLDGLVDNQILSASFNTSNNTLTLTQDDSDTIKVDLNPGISSGELVGNTVVFTRTDSSTFDIDLDGLVDNQILTAAFNSSNNTLTLTTDDSGTIEVDINSGVSSAAFAISNNTVTFSRTDGTNFDVALTGLANTSAPTFTGNVTVTGNLSVLGTTTTIDTSNVLVEDPILLLGKNNGTPAIDFGFYGQRYDDPTDTNLNVAYIWDESQDEFATVFTEDDANNSVLSVSSYADFRANTITVSHLSLSPNVNINVSGDVSGNSTAQLTNLNTDADLTLFLELDASGVTPGTYGSASLVPILTIDEHGRVNNATTTSVAGVSDFRFVSANGTIEIDTADGGFFAAPIDLSSFSTSNLSEGTNLYHTLARVNTAIDNRVTKTFVDALNINATELNNNSGDYYRIASASFEASNNTITFTRGDANTFDVTVSGGVSSGSLVGNTIILTKSDSTTVDIDMNGLVDDLIVSTNWHTSNNTLQLLTDDNTAFNNNISQFDANVTFSNTVVINSITDYTSNSLTTTATTQVNLDTFAIASSRTAKYIISVKEGSKFHSTEIMLLHDGTDVFITEYAKLITDSNLATFTADINGGNLRLRVTPASTNSTEFKLSRQLISV